MEAYFCNSAGHKNPFRKAIIILQLFEGRLNAHYIRMVFLLMVNNDILIVAITRTFPFKNFGILLRAVFVFCFFLSGYLTDTLPVPQASEKFTGKWKCPICWKFIGIYWKMTIRTLQRRLEISILTLLTVSVEDRKVSLGLFQCCCCLLYEKFLIMFWYLCFTCQLVLSLIFVEIVTKTKFAHYEVVRASLC